MKHLLLKISTLRVIICLLLFSPFAGSVYGQGIQGKIIDLVQQEPLPFASIYLFEDSILLVKSHSDWEGNYIITGFDLGVYSVQVKSIGYKTRRVDSLEIHSKTISLDFEMIEEDSIQQIVVVDYQIPIIEPENTASGQTLSKEDIEWVASRPMINILSMSEEYQKVSEEKRRTAIQQERHLKKQERKERKRNRRIDRGRNQR